MNPFTTLATVVLKTTLSNPLHVVGQSAFRGMDDWAKKHLKPSTYPTPRTR